MWRLWPSSGSPAARFSRGAPRRVQPAAGVEALPLAAVAWRTARSTWTRRREASRVHERPPRDVHPPGPARFRSRGQERNGGTGPPPRRHDPQTIAGPDYGGVRQTARRGCRPPRVPMVPGPGPRSTWMKGAARSAEGFDPGGSRLPGLTGRIPGSTRWPTPGERAPHRPAGPVPRISKAIGGSHLAVRGRDATKEAPSAAQQSNAS